MNDIDLLARLSELTGILPAYTDNWQQHITSPKTQHKLLIAMEFDVSTPEKTIFTAFVESTINEVVTKRMVKKQQMQWTHKGAHYMLQTRTAVLNND